VDKKYGLDNIFGFSPERIKTIFDALCDLIKEHRGYTYKLYNYEGAEETALGSLVWARLRAEAHNDERLTSFEKFVLQDVWCNWMKDHAVNFGEVVLFKFMVELSATAAGYPRGGRFPGGYKKYTP
jgi:hypothetical protein